MTRWRWVGVFAPFLLGLAAALVVLLAGLPNPVLYVQADLWIVVFGAGTGVSLLAGLAAVAYSLVERTQVGAALEFAEDRRRFLRRLDHELKNPLTAIMAGLANLAAAERSEDRAASLKSVQSQVGRLRRLVADLRKLSELETRPLDMDSVNMTELLEDSFALAQDHPDAAERRLAISIPRAPWPLPSINGDRDLLVLVLHNLLDNAIKFTRTGDTIEMRAYEDGRQVVIEVADTGPGIPDDDLDYIWEELYRGENARGVQGSGLGLALVRAVVSRHEGNIELRSRPGEGSVFMLRFPVG
jgi:signal transduction histidine kinase